MSFRASLGLMRAGAVRGIPRTLACPQLRAFSATPARLDIFEVPEVMTFKKTGSAALDDKIEQFHRHVVLPSYLPIDQRNKLTNPNCERELSANPLELRVAGSHKTILLPWVPERVSHKILLADIMRQMRTETEWTVLPDVLRAWVGLARNTLDRGQNLPAIARRLSAAKQFPLIMELARSARETGFRLNSHEIVNRILSEIQIHTAINKGYAQDALETGLRHVHTLLELMAHDPEHQPPRDAFQDRPLLKDPYVLNARLHLAAALAVKHGVRTEEDNVPVLAAELAAVWPEDTSLLDLYPRSAYGSYEELEYLVRRDSQRLWSTMPVLAGLRMAAQAVRAEQPELAEGLDKRAASVQVYLDGIVRNRQGLLDLFEGKAYTGLQEELAKL